MLSSQVFASTIRTPIFILQISGGETYLLYKKDMIIAKLNDPAKRKPVLASPSIANPIIANPIIANPILANPIIANPIIANPTITNPVAVAPHPAIFIPDPNATIYHSHKYAPKRRGINDANKQNPPPYTQKLAPQALPEEKKGEPIEEKKNEVNKEDELEINLSKYLRPLPKTQSKKSINDTLSSVILSLCPNRNKISLDILEAVEKSPSLTVLKEICQDKLSSQNEMLTTEVAKLTTLDIPFTSKATNTINDIINNGDKLTNLMIQSENITNNIKALGETLLIKDPQKRARIIPFGVNLILKLFFRISHINFHVDIM